MSTDGDATASTATHLKASLVASGCGEIGVGTEVADGCKQQGVHTGWIGVGTLVQHTNGEVLELTAQRKTCEQAIGGPAQAQQHTWRWREGADGHRRTWPGRGPVKRCYVSEGRRKEHEEKTTSNKPSAVSSCA